MKEERRRTACSSFFECDIRVAARRFLAKDKWSRGGSGSPRYSRIVFSLSLAEGRKGDKGEKENEVQSYGDFLISGPEVRLLRVLRAVVAAGAWSWIAVCRSCAGCGVRLGSVQERKARGQGASRDKRD